MANTAAVVGAGWAGCAAAVELAHAGYHVTLYEAARTLGGRARAVDVNGARLDNGQHILLGAYAETLRLMRLAGVDRAQAILTLPLQMRYPPGHGMDFVAPRLPAPLHLAIALLRARGLAGADKMALARFSTTARWMDWTLHKDCSVSELLARFDQTPRLIQLMWRPLCLAALNTVPERASAQVFLHVLRDSLGARRSSSDMLLPKADLTALFPAAAGAYIEARGGSVRTGTKVQALRAQQDGWQLDASGGADGQTQTRADVVVLAAGAPASAPLLAAVGQTALAAQLDAFDYEPITTCYLQYAAGTRLDLPFYALVDDPANLHFGQFVFDRGQLDEVQSGLFAVVISAAAEAAAMERDALADAIAAQLASVLGQPALRQPLWTQVITEKRATFACTPGLLRPQVASGLPGLAIAGDYTASNYPATLEAAVRSGVAAARAVQTRA
ncbi:hydroxysqualene dehydroxylase HpnE [Massilia sp. CF038]|uniref:hydroxysqualene dehydroxylase HpnE n=1 Tax=Massilia sp. CF038 TaxID=1881045 RepID=UPI000913ACE5|nr:hydroxysqualene dehydroxylase HpnE [Massilia sp. CF038]SHG94722.1 squalene-associated FAD-dependent desaturase [Massilia sp. CF038]